MSWELSDERAFMENLLCQRFNFTLVFYTVILSVAVASPNKIYSRIILILGSLIIFLLSKTLKQCQIKLNAIINELKKDPNHPISISIQKTNTKSVRNIIGIHIPRLFYTSLIAFFILTFFY